jgi:FlaA1/EpsC-like NDP-sugar epimerase
MIVDMIIVILVFNFCYHYTVDYIDAPADTYYVALGVMLPIYFVVLFLFGTYRSLWRYAEAKEFLICTIASFTAGGVYFAISRWAFEEKIPFFFYLLLASCIAAVHVLFRLVYRIYRDYVADSKNSKKKIGARRTMIVGCGDACYHMLSEIKISRSTDVKPVVGIDDDVSKVGKRFNGLDVAGTTEDIERIAKKYRIEQIIIAIPSATNAERASVIEKCSRTGCEVKILPQLIDFDSEDRKFLQRVRDITPDELLGRNTVNIVSDDVLGFIKGKVVLITGGGGSIGSELSRQVAANEPKQLVIVDIYENNAYDIQQELVRKYGKALDLKVVIASVRDFTRIDHIIKTYHPDLIIHAAAHKHVPLMEYSPAEAVKNNIFGTINVATSAKKNGVGRFIMISTDKAVNPTNIMGATKRVCEMFIQSMMNEAGETSFSCVRFGNVLGSNGSVIPLFKRQIAEGGPVTVTHPDIIRYFMTIPEAVQLVLVTGAIGKGGEIFVLDMGEPVKIVDLAKKMISLSGKDIKIEFIGLRPGEKLYEELLMDEEGITGTERERIHIGRPLDIDSERLSRQLDELWEIVSDDDKDDAEMMRLIEDKLHEITPTFVRAGSNTAEFAAVR